MFYGRSTIGRNQQISWQQNCSHYYRLQRSIPFVDNLLSMACNICRCMSTVHIFSLQQNLNSFPILIDEMSGQGIGVNPFQMICSPAITSQSNLRGISVHINLQLIKLLKLIIYLISNFNRILEICNFCKFVCQYLSTSALRDKGVNFNNKISSGCSTMRK